jgi:hypothetical protein
MPEAASVLISTPGSDEPREASMADPGQDAPSGFEPALGLKAGDFVEVRSAADIMSTLDAEGKLDGLPFMPEMLTFCGRPFRVSSRADNTCALGQPRRIEATVHLEQLRCDGSSHRGCEAGCLLLWKEAWLRRKTDGADDLSRTTASVDSSNAYRLLSSYTRKPNDIFKCQATELNSASCPAPLGSPAIYFGKVARDCVSRKRNLSDMRKLAIYFWGKAILSVFKLWTRAPWNSDRYKKTPATALDLRPGEVVRVRGILEILRTLDRKGCNRGMEFKPEMFQFCGRKYQVISSMQRRVDERTGELKGFKSPCIVLQSVYCDGQRSFCRRSNYHYWREIWLSRQ